MDPNTCPTCGAHIDADHPQGLCPACLLKKGLDSESTIQGTHLQCAACRGTLDEDARFCAQCGAAVVLAAAEAQSDPVRAALEAKLRGQYRLVRLLGRGGMGAVYLARDLTLGREVAIKIVRTAADTRELYERFRREARTAARLSHPNIVPLHAFGEVEGMPYFVMGYVRGESLAARLRRDGKLPEDEARRVLAEIADALDHAHRQGVVHRDVKPDNVLLEDESGRALLTDFGLARALGQRDTLTGRGRVVGTPHFMSPEQAAGRADIDARSDIYSLGVMAYAMLTGRLPFEGSTPAEVLTKQLTQEPPPLRPIAPTLSDSTVQTVERCLAKDPGKRWPDARSLKLAVGATEETQIPDALQGVEGTGVIGLAVAMSFTMIWEWIGRDVGAESFPIWLSWPLSIVPTLFVFFYLFVIARLRREGFSLGQSQRTIWREPAWWLWWYPRALRRRGNVWQRLPATVRYLRWSIFAFVAYFFIMYFDLAFFGAGPDWQHQTSFVIALAAIVVAWVFLTIGAQRELKRNGLGPADSRRVMLTVPLSRVSFWARPHIAAILAPASPVQAGRPSESPHGQLQSILRHADEMSGPLRPLGAQAAVAARQLLVSIDDADREIAELARNLEPGEEERLTDKIEALAAGPAGDDACATMRSLLEKQLELIRGLSARIEEARASRNRRVEMLKTLALHLASLRARTAETPTEVRSLSDRVRTLCNEIDLQGPALTEAVAKTNERGERMGEPKRGS